jgi:hypothetical protein
VTLKVPKLRLCGPCCRPRQKVLLLIIGLIILAGCEPTSPEIKEIQQELKTVRSELAEIKLKLGQLETGQQKLLMLGERQPPGPERVPDLSQPGQEEKTLKNLPTLSAPVEAPAPQPLTVDQVLREKDALVGNRVTVRGKLGMVIIHRKSFYLKGSTGALEVIFGNLPDKNTINRLATQDWDGQIIVTGVLSISTKNKAGYQIIAENLEFL